MVSKNYYLNLLKSKLERIKDLTKNGEKRGLSKEQIEYIISGQVILINSIFEIGISDLTSKEIEESFNELYFLRQEIIHESNYKSINNLKEKVDKISDNFASMYDKEAEFFSNLLKFSEKKAVNNLVIGRSINVVKDGANYKFYNLKNDSYLLVPEESVFLITENGSNLKYIVELSRPYALIEKNNTTILSTPEAFFKSNYSVLDKDFTKHYDTFKKVYENYAKISSFDKEKRLLSNKGGSSISVPLFLNDFYSHRKIESFIIDNISYYTSPIPSSTVSPLDYDTFLKNRLSFKTTFTTNESFLIDMMAEKLKKVDENYSNLVSLGADKGQIESFLVSSLITAYDASVSKMKKSFMNTTDESKDIFLKINDYRRFFSHQIYSDENPDKYNVLDFYNNFSKLAKSLKDLSSSINPIETQKELVKCRNIKTTKNNIVFHKSERFVHVGSDYYIRSFRSNDLYFYKNDVENGKVNVLFPYYDNAGEVQVYKRNKDNSFEVVSSSKTHPSIKKDSSLFIDTKNFTLIDTNCSTLLNAYNHFRKNGEKSVYIVFNNKSGENIELTIQRIMSRGLTFPQLVGDLNMTIGHNEIRILDSSGKDVATVMSEKKFKSDNYSIAEKEIFSIEEDVGELYYKKGRLK